MKYIATREGVEVLTGKGPATEKQKEMVTKLLKDFPDMRDSFEYEGADCISVSTGSFLSARLANSRRWLIAVPSLDVNL